MYVRPHYPLVGQQCLAVYEEEGEEQVPERRGEIVLGDSCLQTSLWSSVGGSSIPYSSSATAVRYGRGEGRRGPGETRFVGNSWIAT